MAGTVTQKRIFPSVEYDRGGPRELIGLSTDIREGEINMSFDEGSTWKHRTYPIERRKVDSDPENCGWVINAGNVKIHPTAFLGRDVVVVGSNVTIGENAKIDGKVVIYDHVVIGNGVVFKPDEQKNLEGCYKMANDADELEFLRTEVAKGSFVRFIRVED